METDKPKSIKLSLVFFFKKRIIPLAVTQTRNRRRNTDQAIQRLKTFRLGALKTNFKFFERFVIRWLHLSK